VEDVINQSILYQIKESTMSSENIDDLAKIHQLQNRDKKASLAHDFDTLLSLWSNDGVLNSPDGPTIQGKQAIAKQMAKYRAAGKNYNVIEYEHNFNEIKILNDRVFEWGSYHGTSEAVDTGERSTETGKLMRILKRQPDGNWNCARAIWNVDSTVK
jgi:uncharacterized protein (TIGR02246 family)